MADGGRFGFGGSHEVSPHFRVRHGS